MVQTFYCELKVNFHTYLGIKKNTFTFAFHSLFCPGVCHGDNAIVSASIRTLRTLYQSGRAPSSAVFQEETVARQLVQLVSSCSPLIGQCAATVLAKACQVRGGREVVTVREKGVELHRHVW